MGKLTKKEETEFNLMTVGSMGCLLLGEAVTYLKEIAGRPTQVTYNTTYNINTVNVYNGRNL